MFQKRLEELKFHIIVVVVIKAIIMILTFFNLVTVLLSLCGLCYLILHQPYEIGATGLILHMHNQIYIIECLSVTEPVNTGDKYAPKPTFVLCL